MKSSAVLVNVARGPVVCDEDLYEALVEGEIAGAGLDVTSTEPMKESNPLSRIQDSSRLIITPHMAWASVEARDCRKHQSFLKRREQKYCEFVIDNFIQKQYDRENLRTPKPLKRR